MVVRGMHLILCLDASDDKTKPVERGTSLITSVSSSLALRAVRGRRLVGTRRWNVEDVIPFL